VEVKELSKGFKELGKPTQILCSSRFFLRKAESDYEQVFTSSGKTFS
jgi:hypothetical protein